MCTRVCLEFGRANLRKEEVRGKLVLEVGSRDINGSLRPVVETLEPCHYVGVDIQWGSGVDEICDARDLLDRFGSGVFDLLISTELMEHVKDWRNVIHNFKQVLKPGGVVLITTRSKGFPFHDYPFDFWRYELSDMEAIFSDFVIDVIEKDPLSPGVFLKARKPVAFLENDLAHYPIFSVINGVPAITHTGLDIAWFKVRYRARQFLIRTLPKAFGRFIRMHFYFPQASPSSDPENNSSSLLGDE